MADTWIIREEWTELPIQGAKERFNTRTGQFEAYRKFRGPWIDRFNFLQLVLPQITVTVPGTVNFERNYYFYPGIPGMLAQSAEITGHLIPDMTGPESSLNYEKAEITVTYQADPRTFFLSSGVAGQNPTPDPESPPLQTTYNVTSESQIIRLDGKDVKDAQGNRQHELGDLNFTLTLLNLKVTYHETPYPDWYSVSNNVGKINIGQVLFSDIAAVFPLGSAGIATVRYDGPTGVTKNIIRSWNSVTNQVQWDLAWDITHSFVYNRYRWDRLITGTITDPANGAVSYVTKKVKLYEYSQDNFAFLRKFSILPVDPDEL